MNRNRKILETLSDRLVYALKCTGMRKADLARAIDVKPQVIQFLCGSNTVSSRFTFEIATALGLNTKWLATGEGEMFLLDDPKIKFLKEYKRIPFFTLEELFNYYKDASFPNTDIVADEHTALKTTNEDMFCLKMLDSSMEPILPVNSTVFFERIKQYNPIKGDIVLAVIPTLHATLVREVCSIDGQLLLTPKNDLLYKSTPLTDTIKIIALATDCHISIKKENKHGQTTKII